MDFLTTLHRSGGIAALGRQLGVAPSMSAAAAERLLPALIAAFRELHDCEGAEGFLTILADHGGVSLAAEIMGADAAEPAMGTAILDRLALDLGSGLASAEGVLPSDGAGQDLLDRMLPLLAMLAGGYLSGTALRGEESETVLVALLGGNDGADPASGAIGPDPES